MRISDWSSDVCSSDLPMARKVLAARRHTRQHQALYQGPGQHGDHPWITMEGAVANDLTDTIVQIQHRGETKVYPTRAQLGPKHITCFRRQPHRSKRVLRPKLAEDAHGRNGRKAISAKTLYAAAFVLDTIRRATI